MCSSEAELSSNIRVALTETISELLSSDIRTRNTAENQIKALEVTDDYGLHLTELTLDVHGPMSLRQMCAVLLKRYVDSHWSSLSDNFEQPETPPHVKGAIRSLLPLGLKESISKVRSSIAYTISSIARWDWPDEWPELFNILMAALKDPSEFPVMGAVRVLKEFSRDLSHLQIPAAAPVILPEIFRIFSDSDKYSVRTRTRAIEIFTTFVSMISSMSEGHKAILAPLQPMFTGGLISALNIPLESHASDPGFQTEVIKALTVLLSSMPKAMGQWLTHILPPVWNLLTASANKYMNEAICNSLGNGLTDEDIVDSDGDVLSFDNLVDAIFQFIHGLVDNYKFKASLKPVLSELMYYIVMFTQVSDDQAEKWMENPEQYIEDEENEGFKFAIRDSAHLLLIAFSEEFPDEFCNSLALTVEKHLSEAEERKKNGSPFWWKTHEALMFCIGFFDELIEAQAKGQGSRRGGGNKVKFQIEPFLESIVLPDMKNPVSPFLLGRCYWIAGKFAQRLPPEGLQLFLESTMRSQQEDQMPILRIMALRGIYGYYQQLRSADAGTKEKYLHPILPGTIEALISISSTYINSSEIVGLMLEIMGLVLSCDAGATAAFESKITPVVMAIFLKYTNDPMTTTLVQIVVKVLSQTSGCRESLQNAVVPTLVSALSSNEDSEQKSGLQCGAFELLQTIVRGSGSPISDLIMSSAFPVAIQCTLHSTDHAVLQTGGECLRAFVSVSPEQIVSFTDNSDHQKSGLWYMVQVAGHLLNPVESEFTATFVGRLVTTLISKMGDKLGSDLDLLLKAVLSKLQGSSSLSVIQSLLMVYAQLLISQIGPVINFLLSTPGPKGDTALHFVLTEWLNYQHLFYGFYENKVTTIALAKLLQHAVNTEDLRFWEIKVKGEPIYNSSSEQSVMQTRSMRKSAPETFTEIDALSKIFKLLVNEMKNALNIDEEASEEASEEDEDDGGEVMDEDDAKETPIDSASILDYIRGEEYADEEDPDVLSDPLYNLDLKTYLIEYFQNFSTKRNAFPYFVQNTNPAERKVLSSIGIPIN